MHFLLRSSWAPLALLVAACVGCGGSTGNNPDFAVSGKVTFAGEAVTEGIVVFELADQGAAINAALGVEGAYTVTTPPGGMPAGSYKVSIQPVPVEMPTDADAEPPPPNDPANIPEKYRSAETSGLTADVKAGDNTFDFEMTE